MAAEEIEAISDEAIPLMLETRELASRPEVAEAMAAEAELSAVVSAEDAAARLEDTSLWIEVAMPVGTAPDESPAVAPEMADETWDWIEAAASVV